MKNQMTPALGWAILTTIAGIILISATATVTLILSPSTNQTVHFLGLPIFTIQSDSQGFSVANEIGSIILPLLAGILTFVTTLLSRRSQSPSIN